LTTPSSCLQVENKNHDFETIFAQFLLNTEYYYKNTISTEIEADAVALTTATTPTCAPSELQDLILAPKPGYSSGSLSKVLISKGKIELLDVFPHHSLVLINSK
jgi:hypothetical protein